MLDNIKKSVQQVLPGIFMDKKDISHKTFIPTVMKLVHKDIDGNLASRMMRYLTPVLPMRPIPPKKKSHPWAGSKIKKAAITGKCAGKRTEGVVAGAIRLAKQERMIEQLGSNHVMK